MTILIPTLKEELDTSRKLESNYLHQLAALPKGSFIVRKVGSKHYGYLTRRKDGNVVQEYLGSIGAREIKNYQDKTKKKKLYKQQLKQIREQIKILERALRGQI